MNNQIVDIDVLARIVDRLNTIFDAREIYHHSSGGEMFEAQIKLDGNNVIWGIFFIGRIVASGDECGFFDFDECEEYLKAVKENEEEIFREAYKNTISYFEKTITNLKYSDIGEEEKSKLLNGM